MRPLDKCAPMPIGIRAQPSRESATSSVSLSSKTFDHHLDSTRLSRETIDREQRRFLAKVHASKFQNRAYIFRVGFFRAASLDRSPSLRCRSASEPMAGDDRPLRHGPRPNSLDQEFNHESNNTVVLCSLHREICSETIARRRSASDCASMLSLRPAASRARRQLPSAFRQELSESVTSTKDGTLYVGSFNLGAVTKSRPAAKLSVHQARAGDSRSTLGVLADEKRAC